jgi:putative ATP-dependent endonuclease of OLD family
MATLLAGLSAEPEGELHLLLVEEPEAHLHPQLQALLMRFLESEATAGQESGRVQVVFSTHSPNLASALPLERITAMVRTQRAVTSRFVGGFGLAEDELRHLARFLDVTKASLLFARAVLLVEGLAEQLVMPILAEAAGKNLVAARVAVINVGGLAFGPFAHLFGPDRLPNRCAVVSDRDPPATKDVEAQEEDPPVRSLSFTAERLLADQNENRIVRLSRTTFEWDLVADGNWRWALAALRLLHPRVAARLEKDPNLDTPGRCADAVLSAVEHEKGRFAQALLEVADPDDIVVPEYLREAFEFVCETPAPHGPEEAEPFRETSVGDAQAPVLDADADADAEDTPERP